MPWLGIDFDDAGHSRDVGLDDIHTNAATRRFVRDGASKDRAKHQLVHLVPGHVAGLIFGNLSACNRSLHQRLRVDAIAIVFNFEHDVIAALLGVDGDSPRSAACHAQDRTAGPRCRDRWHCESGASAGPTAPR